MLDNKKQHNYILNMLEMTGQLAERKVENGNGNYNQVQVFETQLGLNLVVSNKIHDVMLLLPSDVSVAISKGITVNVGQHRVFKNIICG